MKTMIEVNRDELAKAVESTHACRAKLREWCAVCEEFQGQTVWEGVVHVFDVDHADADTVYAWSSPIDGRKKRRFYAVLGVPPINCAQDAVRAAIVADNRE